MPTETTELIVPTNETELKQTIDAALAHAKAFVVQSDEDAMEADRRRQALSKIDGFITDLMDEERQNAYDNWKRIVAKIDAHKKPVEEARKAYKASVLPWLEKKELERQAEQRRLESEAKKKADEEALRKAQQEAEFGDQATAQAIVEQAIAAPAPVVKVESSAPKLNGTVFQTRYFATIQNPSYVKEAIEKAGKLLHNPTKANAAEAAEILRQAYQDAQFMAYDQQALNKLATATKGAIKLGGVTFGSRKV